MLIHFDDGRCGDGKTFEALKAIVSEPKKYILAVDKTDLLDEREKDVLGLAGEYTDLVVTGIDHRVSSGVVSAVEAIADNPVKHHLVIITHKALKLAKFDKRFADWTLIIDEDFSTLTSDCWNLVASLDHFRSEFTLKPYGDFFEIVPSSHTINSYEFDDAFSDKVVEFRRLMDQQKIITDKPEIGEHLTWWSVWNYRRLKNFSSVTILANAFTEKLSYHLASMSDIKFSRIERVGSRAWTSRPVTINYFSETNGSMNFFVSTKEGKANLAKIETWQNANHTGSEFWSANEKLCLSLTGKHIKPMAAGRNDLMNCDVATFIYSAQASPSESKAMNLMSGGKLDGDLIKRDREFEALSQFVLRGSLRQPNCDRAYSIRVYSREQAEFVRGFLTRNGYVDHGDVSIEFIDVGLEGRSSKKTGRPTKVPTPEEIAEREVRKRENNRLRQKRFREKALTA